METAGKQRRASGCAALRWLLAPGPLGRSQDHVILRRKREPRSDAQVPCLHLPLRPPPPMLSPRPLGPYGRPEGGTGSSEKPNHPGGWQVAELGLEPETPAQGRPSHVLPRRGAGSAGSVQGRGPGSGQPPRAPAAGLARGPEAGHTRPQAGPAPSCHRHVPWPSQLPPDPGDALERAGGRGGECPAPGPIRLVKARGLAPPRHRG